jgi:hypothetical protein
MNRSPFALSSYDQRCSAPNGGSKAITGDGEHSLRDLPIMIDTARRTFDWLVRHDCC